MLLEKQKRGEAPVSLLELPRCRVSFRSGILKVPGGYDGMEQNISNLVK